MTRYLAALIIAFVLLALGVQSAKAQCPSIEEIKHYLCSVPLKNPILVDHNNRDEMAVLLWVVDRVADYDKPYRKACFRMFNTIHYYCWEKQNEN